ncbi:MAG: YlbE family protein [Solirubrobacteraceae bacterium]
MSAAAAGSAAGGWQARERPGLRVLDEAPARAVGVALAGDALRCVGPRRFLHAGPPVGLAELVGPMRGAICGALVLEGQARDIEQAQAILDAGELELSPCHDAGAVGAMAGIVSPSIPLVLVEGAAGIRSFAPLNEGLGQALRFGSTSRSVLERLRWLSRVATPLLDAAIRAFGGIDVVALQAEGLRRGDECHNRNVASTAALTAMLAPEIARAARDSGTAAATLELMSRNPHFFLSFSMAGAKAVADAAERAGAPGIVTAIAANGRRIGVRVSGVEGWLTAPAPRGRPRLFEGFTAQDACPMMGDSFMTEVIGIGAFALSAAPAIGSFIGASAAQAREIVARMRSLCATSSSRFLIPAEEFAGTPLGIDVDRVALTRAAPVVNNGFAHREAGVGQVGAGLTELPLEPFVRAARELAMGAHVGDAGAQTIETGGASA